jgi:hypothetical protein
MKYCRMVSTGANAQLSGPTGGEPASPPATRIRADTQLRGDPVLASHGCGQHDPQPEPDGVQPAHRPCARCRHLVSLSDKTIWCELLIGIWSSCRTRPPSTGR